MDKDSEESRKSPASGTKSASGDSSVSGKKSKKKGTAAVNESPAPASDSSTDEEPEARVEKWNCSVCTFENSAEAFKCSMCFVRKGTSTRKPRINVQLQAQQVARQQQQIQQQALKATARAKEENRPEKKRPPSPSSSIGTLSTSSESKRRNSDADPLVSPGPSKSRKEGKKGKKAEKLAKTKKETNGQSEKKEKKGTAKKMMSPVKNFRLRNIDHNNSMSRPVTVNNVTVIITEFKPMRKEQKAKKTNSPAKAKSGEKKESNGQNHNSSSGGAVANGVKENRETEKGDTVPKKKTGKKSNVNGAPVTPTANHHSNHCSSESRNGS